MYQSVSGAMLDPERSRAQIRARGYLLPRSEPRGLKTGSTMLEAVRACPVLSV